MAQTGQVCVTVRHLKGLDVLHIAQRQADRALQIAGFQCRASSKVDRADRRSLEAGDFQGHTAGHVHRCGQIRAMVDSQLFQHGQRREVQLDRGRQVDVGIAVRVAANDDGPQLGCGREVSLIRVYAGDALDRFQHGRGIDVNLGIVQCRISAHAQRDRLAALATLLLQDGAEQDGHIQVRIRRDGDSGNLTGRACEAAQGDLVVPGRRRIPFGSEVDTVVLQEIVALKLFRAVHHGDKHGDGRAALFQILIRADILAPRICNQQTCRAELLVGVKGGVQAVGVEQLRQGGNHRVQAVGQQVADVGPQDRILCVEDIAAVQLVGVLHAIVQREVALVVVAHGRVHIVTEAVVPDGMLCRHVMAMRERVFCAVVRHSEERGEQVVVQGGLALKVQVELVHELGSTVFCRIIGIGHASVHHRAAQGFAGRRAAVGGIHPLDNIAPRLPGHGLVTAIRDVAERQRRIGVVVALPAGSVFCAFIALETVVDVGVIAQLHDALIGALGAVKTLRLFVFLRVAEIANAVENPLTLREALFRALVIHEDNAGVELHRVAHLWIRCASRPDIRLVLVE